MIIILSIGSLFSCSDSTKPSSELTEMYANARKAYEIKDYTSVTTILASLDSKDPKGFYKDSIASMRNLVTRQVAIQDSIAEVDRQAMIAEKEKVIAEAKSTMRIENDEFKGVTRYFDKSSPKYVDINGFYAYVIQPSEGTPFMLLNIQYADDDWLFIEGYTILVDGQRFEIREEEYGEIKTDNGYGGIWEWLTRVVGPDELKMIEAMKDGKEVKIRYNGKDYYHDDVITETQKKALRNVYNLYQALGGEPI